MGFDFLTLINNFSQFQQFKNDLQRSGADPAQLLTNELKRRNVSKEQFNALLDEARKINNFITGFNNKGR